MEEPAAEGESPSVAEEAHAEEVPSSEEQAAAEDAPGEEAAAAEEPAASTDPRFPLLKELTESMGLAYSDLLTRHILSSCGAGTPVETMVQWVFANDGQVRPRPGPLI